MRTFKLTIAYDGTEFAGWQVQPERPTIQSALQSAVRSVVKEDLSVVGSGRTDAGVHAVAQVASCVVSRWRATAAELARALNANLPDTISIVEAEEAAEGFHALRDAIGKRYRYQLRVGGPRDPFGDRFNWHLRRPLDIDAIRDAASRLVGRHDFASFQAAGSERKTTVRHVRACDVTVIRTSPDSTPPTDGVPRVESARDDNPPTRIAIEVEADGFLYNMVRNIVGTLVEVGRGKREPASIEAVLQARNRDAAGPTAPAHGLLLLRVDYPPPDDASEDASEDSPHVSSDDATEGDS